MIKGLEVNIDKSIEGNQWRTEAGEQNVDTNPGEAGKNDKNRLENKVGKSGVGAIGDCPYLPILSTFLAGEGAKCNRQTITEI